MADLAFLWHMHQPDYRDHLGDEFVLPWVYLHALKDYADMVAHLERHPAIRAVVNFVPVLLDQIDDYCIQFETGRFRDPLLRALAEPEPDRLNLDDRRLLLDPCFRSSHGTMLSPFPRYRHLHELHKMLMQEGGEAGLASLSGAYFADLVTWYYLVWTGETERRNRPLIAELMTKGQGYSLNDRQRLLDAIGDILRGLVPRYRALAEAGRTSWNRRRYIWAIHESATSIPGR